LGIESWRKGRGQCEVVCEQVAGEGREQCVTVFVNIVLERGRREFGGIWELFAGERIRQILTVF